MDSIKINPFLKKTSKI